MPSILQIKNLKKYFPITRGAFARHIADIKAVDNVSLKLKEGETLGLVGESGCGKTTIGRCMVDLEKPTAGSVLYRETCLLDMTKKEFQRYRREVQIVFQDPYSSLNPRKTVAQIIGEALLVHGLCKTSEERDQRVLQLLHKVGLDALALNRYPHEFSGGQRQRIGIARAIALEPKVLICDESVAALDVSVQAQVLNLLMKLKKEMNLTMVFISHDLSVVRHIADRVAVMYLGQLMEISPTAELFENPRHPYTKALLASLPGIYKTVRESRILEGEVPDPFHMPPGCVFCTRCPEELPVCREVGPQMKWLSGVHQCKCHLVDDRRQGNQGPPEQPERRAGIQIL